MMSADNLQCNSHELESHFGADVLDRRVGFGLQHQICKIGPCPTPGHDCFSRFLYATNSVPSTPANKVFKMALFSELFFRAAEIRDADFHAKYCNIFWAKIQECMPQIQGQPGASYFRKCARLVLDRQLSYRAEHVKGE